ncbi:copper resistance CopC family protein [Cohnella herbarum]|uniref:Copper resistance protein CopC n=1 Tax=Cohnella herbarum TaxID=2728023 RepID=A0A7Z2VH43_9BACL|nr:copper resistance protein CopC [Cohnella herbarum]QJD82982.1 copper resistance protein CopC [Cohnella herbarum]
MKRTKWLILTAFVLAILAPTSAFAHTGLKSSTPENKQIVDAEVNEIKMTFNTDIEKLSSFKVVDAQGTEYEIADKLVDKSSMSGGLNSPLKDGEYTVDWKIIGKDGHPIKGSFAFSVRVPATATPSASPSASASASPSSSPSSSEDPVASESLSPAPSETNTSNPSASESSQPDSESDSSDNTSLEVKSKASDFLLYAAGAVFLLFVALYLRRKKR